MTLAFVVASALSACGGSGSQPTKQLNVGALLALTGEAAPIGAEQLRAMRLAVDQTNAAGGIDGTKLNLMVADTHSDPSRSAVEMRRLIGEGVTAVLGPTLSIEAVRADPVANQLQTPVLSVSNTAPRIVGNCPYPCQWIWRDSLGGNRTVAANVASLLQEGTVSSVALVHSASDYLAASETQIAQAAFEAAGVRITANVQLPPPGSGRRAVNRDIARALKSRPSVLFVTSSDGEEAAVAIRLARADGFRGNILAGDSLNSAGATQALKRAGQGVRTGAAWYGRNDFPANINFVRAFINAFHAEPDQFAAQAYTGIQILAQAIGRGGARAGDLTLAQRRSAIGTGLGQVALTTPLGPFRFTSTHDVSQIVWILEGDGRGGHTLAQFCNPGC